ncbi:MAG: ABC transporter ATP-binding protein [Duodenibacillus sp.]|nr:ABC transporter ATP-binding protein [Duodenibacillus sp.]
MQISLENVRQSYGGQVFFDNLSLTIGSGQFFTLLGPSGCGKTTLLRILAGFVKPDSGRVMFGDRDVSRTPVHRRNIGIVFQDYALFPDRSVLENVSYGLYARGVARAAAHEKSHAMLARVGLEDFAQCLPSALSGGQKQRVAMARALVIEPDVLLLDEPLSALDVKLRIELRLLIRTLQRQSGITTLFVTHDQAEAFALSDRIAVMQRGRIVQMGTPQSIYERPSCTFVAEFMGCNRLTVLEELAPAGGKRVLRTRCGLVATDDDMPLARGMKLSVRINDIGVKPAEGPAGAVGRIRGRLCHAEFRGPTVEYIVETEDGLIHAEVPNAGETIPVDSMVDLVFPLNGRLTGELP